jgi:hypothetical protein
MKYLALVAVLALVSLGGPAVSAGPRLELRVSPAVSLAPAVIMVRTIIEPSDDNRLLNVEIDSPSFWRSSEITLDGKNAQRVNLLEVRDVPSGLYEVRAMLKGPSGEIAQTMQFVKVESAPGAR